MAPTEDRGPRAIVEGLDDEPFDQRRMMNDDDELLEGHRPAVGERSRGQARADLGVADHADRVAGGVAATGDTDQNETAQTQGQGTKRGRHPHVISRLGLDVQPVILFGAAPGRAANETTMV